jgi:hypothetical protein
MEAALMAGEVASPPMMARAVTALPKPVRFGSRLPSTNR